MEKHQLNSNRKVDIIGLGTGLIEWAGKWVPAKVQLSSAGWPDDPRAASPEMVVAVARLLHSTAEVVEGVPGCQVWTTDGEAEEAGAELAAILRRAEGIG